VTNIDQAIRQALVDGQLPCAAAFALAESLRVHPLKVGQAADRLELRLSRCQLGLFGYGQKAEGSYRRVKPTQDIPGELAAAIRASLDQDGRLSCEDAWRIASELRLPKQVVANAAEGLTVRIVHCQLGAF
jgi:hypothetical protein